MSVHSVPADTGDWTEDPDSHRSNSSPEFNRLVAVVARILRNSSHDLISGNTHGVAVLIMAQLAHKEGLPPPGSSSSRKSRWRPGEVIP